MTRERKEAPMSNSLQKKSGPDNNGARLLAPTKAARGVTRHKLRFLSHSVQLEEAGPPGFLTGIILIAAFFVVGAVAWATATNVTSAAQTSGTVVPMGTI